jgi:hypothetical protein
MVKKKCKHHTVATRIADEIAEIVGESKRPVAISYKKIINRISGGIPLVSRIDEVKNLGIARKHFRAFSKILLEQYDLGIVSVNVNLFNAFNIQDAGQIRLTEENCNVAMLKLGLVKEGGQVLEPERAVITYCQGKSGSPAVGVVACPPESRANLFLSIPIERQAKVATTISQNCVNRLDKFKANGAIETTQRRLPSE